MNTEDIHQELKQLLEPVGFEVHPFKIGWYNDKVLPVFKLDYSPDTLAFNVISTPTMFDKAFKPYVCRQECTGVADPIDQCMKHYFARAKELFGDKTLECIHDFELNHNRRPKILVQTAGHVSGSARYYQKQDVEGDPWGPGKKIFGVSVHPTYGGWFSLRGVMIFTTLEAQELAQRDPPDVVASQSDRVELLTRFNTNWKDWSFRDIIPVAEKYSEEQKKYYATLPKDRFELLSEIKHSSLSAST